MRDTGRITTREMVLRDGDLSDFRTNARGNTALVNRSFIDIRGFFEQELFGAPRNLVLDAERQDFLRDIRSA